MSGGRSRRNAALASQSYDDKGRAARQRTDKQQAGAAGGLDNNGPDTVRMSPVTARWRNELPPAARAAAARAAGRTPLPASGCCGASPLRQPASQPAGGCCGPRPEDPPLRGGAAAAARRWRATRLGPVEGGAAAGGGGVGQAALPLKSAACNAASLSLHHLAAGGATSILLHTLSAPVQHRLQSGCSCSARQARALVRHHQQSRPINAAGPAPPVGGVNIVVKPPAAACEAPVPPRASGRLHGALGARVRRS